MCCLPLAFCAAETDTLTRKEFMLDAVVVKSFKQEKDLRISPISATSVTGSIISKNNLTNIKNFSGFIPNIFMPDYGSKLTSPIYIRGIGSKINSPSVGLYVDGIPYFEKSAFDFSFTEIDRLEVLRGPQGTLYGRNTMGGIINVYTKSPLKHQGTHISALAGSYGEQNYDLSYYKKCMENLGIALSGNFNHTNGYFMNRHTGEKADKVNAGNVRFRLEWNPTEQWSIGFSSVYDRSVQGGYPYAICDSITYYPGEVNYDAYSFYKRTLSTTGLTLGYQQEHFALNSQSAFQYSSDHQGIDQDFSPKSLYFARQDQQIKMFSEEFNIKSVSDSNYQWLFGTFGFYQHLDNTVILEYLSKDYSTRKLYSTPTYGLAFYHQSTIRNLFVEGLSLTLGLRYDYERALNDYLYYRDQQGTSKLVDELDGKLKFSQLMPKASLQYTFESSGLIYATVSKGYKTGGFNTSFDDESDRTFDPENSWNYEIGAKHPFFDRRLKAEISLFWIDWRNQQISQTLASGKGSMLKNAGRSESKGVELSFRYNPMNGLILNANYGFTHATFSEFKDEIKKTDYSGKYLPMVPKHTLGLAATYTKFNPCRFLDQVSVGVNCTGNGKIYWKEDNRFSQSFYALLNANVSVTKKMVTLGLWARNLTNTKYTSFFFQSMGNHLGQQGRPFSIGTKISITL